eukprot:s2190_g2.t1
MVEALPYGLIEMSGGVGSTVYIDLDDCRKCLQLADKDTGRVFRIRLSKRAAYAQTLPPQLPLAFRGCSTGTLHIQAWDIIPPSRGEESDGDCEGDNGHGDDTDGDFDAVVDDDDDDDVDAVEVEDVVVVDDGDAVGDDETYDADDGCYDAGASDG